MLATSRTAWLRLLTALMCAILVGCGNEPGGGGRGDFDAERMHEVAADKDATAEEIIEAGVARRMKSSASGQTLAAYLAKSDDDEEPQASAWRLYDADGGRVADGSGVKVSEQSALPEIWPLDDGFLIGYDNGTPLGRIDNEGKLTTVDVEERGVPTAPGDLLVRSSSGSAPQVYRPADDTTYSLRLPDRRRFQDADIDGQGGVWVLLTKGRGATVSYSSDGQEPWRELPIQVTRGSYPARIDAVGDQVYVPLATQDMDSRVSALLVQDAAAPDAWRSADIADLDTRGWSETSLDQLPNGRLLISDFNNAAYVGSPQEPEPGWTEISPPSDDEPGFSLEAAAGRLYAISVLAGPTYVSDDLGETWRELPR